MRTIRVKFTRKELYPHQRKHFDMLVKKVGVDEAMRATEHMWLAYDALKRQDSNTHLRKARQEIAKKGSNTIDRILTEAKRLMSQPNTRIVGQSQLAMHCISSMSLKLTAAHVCRILRKGGFNAAHFAKISKKIK